MKAIALEFSILVQLGVMSIVDRKKVSSGANIGNCFVMLTKKRCGKVESRCDYNGESQMRRLTKNFRSPALSEDALSISLAVVASKNWDIMWFDTTCAFPYAALLSGTLVFAEILDGHIDFERRDQFGLQFH